jgi:hypothetical protein
MFQGGAGTSTNMNANKVIANRMTPNTFEAYRINRKYAWVQFGAGYVAQIKPRNDNEFTSMSEQAGAPPGRERGMIAAGIRFTPLKGLSFGAINYYVPDTWNIFYTEGNYTWPLTDELALKLQGQFTEQGSVGGDNLIGNFDTRVGGAQASLSYRNAVFRMAFSTSTLPRPYRRVSTSAWCGKSSSPGLMPTSRRYRQATST